MLRYGLFHINMGINQEYRDKANEPFSVLKINLPRWFGIIRRLLFYFFYILRFIISIIVESETVSEPYQTYLYNALQYTGDFTLTIRNSIPLNAFMISVTSHAAIIDVALYIYRKSTYTTFVINHIFAPGSVHRIRRRVLYRLKRRLEWMNLLSNIFFWFFIFLSSSIYGKLLIIVLKFNSHFQTGIHREV